MPVLSEAALRHLVALRGADAPPVHVLDVGANPIEGDAPYKQLLELGLCRVTGFEPQPKALAQLLERKGPLEHYLPDALGDGDDAPFHVTHQGGFSSVFPADKRVARLLGFARAMRPVETLTVPTRRLDSLDEVGPVDFLKIDVQGSELAIIRNGAARLSSAVAVQTEVRLLPVYAGEPRFGALDDELSKQGFAFHDFVHLKRVNFAGPRSARLRRRSARQVVDGDAIYLRDLSRAELMSDDQLFRMAILAVGAFESATAAVHCLDLLAERGRVSAADADAFVNLLPDTLTPERAR